MPSSHPSSQRLAEPHTPTLFLRHNRPLRVLLQESQIWFCARDLGRLMGRKLDERTATRLDEDQWRFAVLADHRSAERELMVSESAVYGLLAKHFHAENRGLRWWISNEVVPAVRDGALPLDEARPSLGLLQWPGLSVSLLHWQGEQWLRLRDMPRMLPHGQLRDEAVRRNGRLSRWRAVWQVLRLG